MPKRNGTELEEASDKIKPCQCYKHEYTELWNCLKPSTKGDTFVQCSLPIVLTSHMPWQKI